MNATVAAAGFMDIQSYSWMVEPLTTWTYGQMALFPLLFIIPAELFALLSDTLVAIGPDALPGPPKSERQSLKWQPDIAYIIFNRLVLIPLVSFLNIKVIWASRGVVYDWDQMTLLNTIVGFLVVFTLSDLTYYIGHRIVHKFPMLYGYVHKHHHQEAVPRRGWNDTCNAHPSDFFYTGVCTSPMSCIWLMPVGSVHITAIFACLYFNAFAGALGHCRLDLNLYFFNTRFHAGHHANSRCNFAQNIELWDRLFGTYKELRMTKVSDKAEKLM